MDPMDRPPVDVEEAEGQRPVRFVGSRRAGRGSHRTSADRRQSGQIPEDIRLDPALNDALRALPTNYSFEIHKTVWRLRQAQSRCVALQFPEGLLLYACVIADILQRFTKAECIILGDVTYGACCVDDFTARALGADFMVHYGHSCLVPITTCSIPVLYVFVDVQIDVQHFLETIKLNFAAKEKLALVSTIQFVASLQVSKRELERSFHDLIIPQVKPLSPGEVLGCTSPHLPDRTAIIFLGDGRFHLESVALANPGIPTFQYNPYSKVFSRERMTNEATLATRRDAITRAATSKTFGVILGTLGRQGNPRILSRIEELLQARRIEYIVVLLSEVFPHKLSLFPEIEAWIQIACPRLSTDWGTAFNKPLLSAYEAMVALQTVPIWQEQRYPMDFYAQGGGPWTNYHTPVGKTF